MIEFELRAEVHEERDERIQRKGRLGIYVWNLSALAGKVDREDKIDRIKWLSLTRCGLRHRDSMLLIDREKSLDEGSVTEWALPTPCFLYHRACSVTLVSLPPWFTRQPLSTTTSSPTARQRQAPDWRMRKPQMLSDGSGRKWIEVGCVTCTTLRWWW